MKQLHNALCHPAATVAQTVETSHYKSHIQAPFTTYGTSVMLASESSRSTHVLAAGRNAESLVTVPPNSHCSPNDVVRCLDMDAHL